MIAVSLSAIRRLCSAAAPIPGSASITPVSRESTRYGILKSPCNSSFNFFLILKCFLHVLSKQIQCLEKEVANYLSKKLLLYAYKVYL